MMTDADDHNPIRLTAAGDLLLAPSPHGQRDVGGTLAALAGLFADSDLRFANLECTLPGEEGTVPTEPRVISTPEMVRGIEAAGINVVCLANNHMFDALRSGFDRLRGLLGEMGIAHFGAGDGLAEATAPAILDVRGRRVAFVAGTDESCGPSHLAAAGQFGVAPLEMDRLVGQVRELAGEVDHVIVSLHWGIERFRVPSPRQVDRGRALIEAGAALVLGHHPHVVQGLERHAGGAIAYSLGNFLSCEVYYEDDDVIEWNRSERVGMALKAELSDTGLGEVQQVPTYDDGRAVRYGDLPYARRLIERRNRALARGITPRRYRREHLRVHTLRPILQHLRFSKLKTLRPAKLRRALQAVRAARRAD